MTYYNIEEATLLKAAKEKWGRDVLVSAVYWVEFPRPRKFDEETEQ